VIAVTSAMASTASPQFGAANARVVLEPSLAWMVSWT
jgi:hypothetical protein